MIYLVHRVTDDFGCNPHPISVHFTMYEYVNILMISARPSLELSVIHSEFMLDCKP